jgi:hypothetical protein
LRRVTEWRIQKRMETAQQASQQEFQRSSQTDKIERLRRIGFQPGRSGNPSGKTKTQLRTDELFAEFARVHGCKPSVSDAMRLRSAGKLAAKLERNAGTAGEIARMTRTLVDILKQLRLNSLPVSSASSSLKVPMPSGYEARK